MVRSSARSYYELLSVAATADGIAIERAFRRCCFIIFCDFSDDARLADHLLPVSEAYYVLSHSRLRDEYDRDGECSLDPAELHCRAIGERDAALVRLRPAIVARNGEGWIHGHAPAVATAAELLRGTTRRVRVPCGHCEGVGWLPVDPLPCPVCAVTTPARRALSPLLVRMGVEAGCGGCYDRRFIGERACPACSGLGIDPDAEVLRLPIPAGTAPGTELCHPLRAGGVDAARGQLPVAVLLEPDPRFRSRGVDVIAQMPISRADLIRARLGRHQHRFEGITETLEFEVPQNAVWGDSIRIPGAGLPMGVQGERGDLVLQLVARRQIVMPPERRYRRRPASPVRKRIRAIRRAVTEARESVRRRLARRKAEIVAMGGMTVRRPSVVIAGAALLLTAGAAVGSLARGPRPQSSGVSGGEQVASGPSAPVEAPRADVASGGGEVHASSTRSSAASASSSVTASASGTRIVAVRGLGQSGAAAAPLGDSIVVRLVDAEGRPRAHEPVAFVVLTGRGAVSPRRVTTDGDGLARTRWTLGPSQPLQAIAAMAEDNSVEVVVTAHVAGAEAARASVLSGGQQSAIAGEALDRPVQLQVYDRAGRPAVGVRVSFGAEQGGNASPSEVVTDEQGVARTRWQLGPQTGQQRLSVRAGGLEPIELTARAIAAPLSVRSGLATGGTYTCRLRNDGTLTCWGGNASGQLGDGKQGGRSAPTVAEGHLRFAVVAGGLAHTCALTADGAAYCWGAGSQGQLGDGRFDDVAEPQEVEGGPYTVIAAGSSHSCALDRRGHAYCWGGNESGQLGNGTTRVGARPQEVSGGTSFAALALGWSHSCALDAKGLAHCWGRNALGQLGTSDLRDRSRPATVAGAHAFRALVAGSAHTCGLTAGGVAYCWGHDNQGQLGNGESGRDRSAPVRVDAPQRFVQLTAGSVHTCGLTAQGGAYCWGGNAHGQLGDGSATPHAAPVAVLGDHRFRSIHASGAHTCATDTAGRDYCWGYNMEGQLGDGTRTSRAVPTPVSAGGSR